MNSKFNNAPEYVFNNPDYISYVVEYQGDIEKDAKLSSQLFITVINDRYAIVTFPFKDPINDRYTLEKNPFPSIAYISRYYVYTLQANIEKNGDLKESINPIITSNISLIQNMHPLNLTGKGVVVGILDTGIDYMNKEFIKNDGTTRILSVWDQTINNEDNTKKVPFGKEYTKEEINSAIRSFTEGKSPYDIVPLKDEIGHGTAMAGIIGAKGVNEDIIGAAPECDFVVVKLSRALGIEKALKSKKPLYDRASIMLGLEYLYNYAINNNIPMVIYLPLGTSLGNHKLNGILENFIDDICNNIGIAVITSTGNEGDVGNHTSGIINESGEVKDVDIYISPEQSFLRMELWTSNPNIMSIEILSPSGETSGLIPALLKKQQINKYIFEETVVSVEYFLPDDLTGDELVYIGFASLQPGIWKVRIYGDYIIDGGYDMWMLPKDVLLGETRFSSPDNYGTITNPGPGRYSITIANYDQNNFNIVGSSGTYFSNSVFNQIDVATGGVNVKTIGPDDTIVVANGTGVSCAVVAGAAAIMFQWGIVEKNDTDMYAQTLKTYFLRGTIKRLNDIYPNPEWGFGILDLVGVFRNLE